ncbi:MAG: MarR family winged helix-turn-helix transcriptional regulator [Polyangiales bacterium]
MQAAHVDDRGPLLGALLRRCHRAIEANLERGFREAGLVPVHGAATQPLWDRPEGMRLTELAAIAGITKQSMGELVSAMESAGYVERVPDERDARARLVRLTRKGRSAGRLARKLVREVESAWAKKIGAQRLEQLRETLQILNTVE